MTPADELRSILVAARLLGMPTTHLGYVTISLWLTKVEAGRPGHPSHGDIDTTLQRARSWLGSVRGVYKAAGPAGLQR